LVAFVGIILLVPLFVLVGLLIKFDSQGSVFYRQMRVGFRGQPFMILKFRSMSQDAEKSGPRWAEMNDPRVSRVGRWLRKLRIDELPQLINVLKGEMSLVGPRPERPMFVQELREKIPYYDLRHTVRPGITGWAQSRFRYGASIGDAHVKLQYDLYYVKNMSLALDFRILIETARVVLFAEGAR
jgi:lipopolysaccharide/colanic/teichoic acid biosynthesis glycosyltransferase